VEWLIGKCEPGLFGWDIVNFISPPYPAWLKYVLKCVKSILLTSMPGIGIPSTNEGRTREQRDIKLPYYLKEGA